MKLGKITIKNDMFLAIVKRHGVKSVALFGSSLRGDFNKNSDIDLLIEFKKPAEKSLLDLIELRLELEDILKRKVDLVEKGSIKNPYKKKEIISTARTIYAG